MKNENIPKNQDTKFIEGKGEKKSLKKINKKNDI